MSRRATWAALIVLVGLLFASWWSIYRNEHQGEEAKKAQAEQSANAADDSSSQSAKAEDEQRLKKREEMKNKIGGKLAVTETAPISTPTGTDVKNTVPNATIKGTAGPDISPDWFRKRTDGQAAIPPNGK
jgi:cytoskeletal protein RodZ